MKIYLSPQVSDERIRYRFGPDEITAIFKGETEAFDFSEFPDGVLQKEGIKTILDVNPIISAKREAGELKVELLNFISSDATEAEKFPEWFDPDTLVTVSDNQDEPKGWDDF